MTKLFKRVLICIGGLSLTLVFLFTLLFFSFQGYRYHQIVSLPEQVKDYESQVLEDPAIGGRLELYANRYNYNHFLFFIQDGERELIGQFYVKGSCEMKVTGDHEIEVVTQPWIDEEFYQNNPQYSKPRRHTYTFNLKDPKPQGVLFLYRVLTFISEDYKVVLD